MLLPPLPRTKSKALWNECSGARLKTDKSWSNFGKHSEVKTFYPKVVRSIRSDRFGFIKVFQLWLSTEINIYSEENEKQRKVKSREVTRTMQKKKSFLWSNATDSRVEPYRLLSSTIAWANMWTRFHYSNWNHANRVFTPFSHATKYSPGSILKLILASDNSIQLTNCSINMPEACPKQLGIPSQRMF